MLNLTYVEAFVTILEAGSFQDAARRLGRAQPTVSLQLQKLEDGLGVTLIARSRTRCSATPEGERFLPYARSLLRLASQACHAANHSSVVVGATNNIGIYVLQPYVKQFIDEANSDDAVQLTLGSNPEVLEKLMRGEVDLALMEWWDERPGYWARVWRREPMVVIVRPDHPWAEHAEVKKEWLLEATWIGGETGTGTATLMRQVLGDMVRKLRIAANLGSTEAVKAAVKAGLGVSLVLASSVREEVETGSLKALPVEGASLEKDVWIIHSETRTRDALMGRFVNGLLQAQAE
jgi:DNA-binding transcriptional LysR family regulator